MANKISVEIIGDTSKLESAFRRAGVKTEGFGSKLGSLAKGAALAAGAAGVAGLTATIVAGVKEYSSAERVAAQTNAVIKSTGGVANVSAKHVDEMASKILRLSGMDDEAVASGENMLLTFRNIRNEAGKGNDIFDQSTQAVMDMTAAFNAMGKETKPADMALQLGKALNDPATGMSRLQRIGVTFTKGQIDAAKAMAASGNIAGAQKIILAELNKEFGGSAEAAGKTLPGKLSILRESFNNVAGEIVGAAAPAMTTFFQKALDALPKFEDLMRRALGYVAPAIRGLADAFDKAWPGISALLDGMASVLRDALVPIWQKLSAIGAKTIEAIGKVLKKNGPQIKAIFSDLGKIIKNLSKVILPILAFAFEKVLPVALRIAIPIVKLFSSVLAGYTEVAADVAVAIGSFCKFVAKTIPDAFGSVITWLKRNWPEIATVISGPFALIVGPATGAFGVRDALVKAFQAPASWLGSAISGITGFITGKASDFATAGATLGGKVKDAILGTISNPASWISGKVTAIATAIANLPGEFASAGTKLGGRVKSALLDVFASPASWVRDKIGGVASAIGGYVSDFASAGAKLGKAFFDAIWGALKNIGAKIAGVLKGPINAVFRALNAIEIPSVSVKIDTHIPGVGKVGFTIPSIDLIPGTIPLLDSGGIVTGPTLAALAMNRRPEAVVPLGRGGLGNTYVFNVPLSNVWGDDPKAVARRVHDELNSLVDSGEIPSLFTGRTA